MGHSAPVWDHNAAVELTQDWNGIDQIVLRNPQGASARVSLHGGQVTSWRSDRGEELLFTSNKEMSEHKRVRTHYSQLPEEEKEWLRARKKTLAAEWKEKESQLVFVDIQQVDDLANPREVENLSSFSAVQIYNHRNLTAAASGSSTLQPHNGQDEYCKLLNVNIGVMLGTLTPLPTVWQPAVPTESYELPAVARCMFCKVKKSPF